MEESMELYVKVNHKQIMHVDKVKTPHIFRFATVHIDEIMDKLATAMKKTIAHNEKLEKDPDTPKLQLQIPIAYVVKKQWDELCKGINEPRIIALTLCFSNSKLLCDIRWDPEDMRLNQLTKMSKGKSHVEKDVKLVEFVPKFVMPDFPSQN